MTDDLLPQSTDEVSNNELALVLIKKAGEVKDLVETQGCHRRKIDLESAIVDKRLELSQSDGRFGQLDLLLAVADRN